MKIADMYAGGRFGLSFEIFPPKTPQGMESLWETVEALHAFEPSFISCTYGAGGTTRDQTLEIVRTLMDRWRLTATAHLTCVGSTVAEIRQWLGRAEQLGVQNVMALRGDPPRGETTFRAVDGGLRYASELVSLIRSEFPQFGIGVAGYPETHQEALSPEADLVNLQRKVEAGADAVYTQLFYDNDDFFRFRDRCRRIGITVPIIPGLLPILSFSQIQRITSMCKARLPRELVSRLAAAADDPAAQIELGIEHATRQCDGLLRADVPGIHFYVLNRSEATGRVLLNLDDLLPRR